MSTASRIGLVAIALASCGKGKGAEDSTPRQVAIAKLGLTIVMPGPGVKVKDDWDGGPGVQIVAKGPIDELYVAEAVPPKNLETVKEDVLAGTRGLAAETLPDGFVITYQHDSALGEMTSTEVFRTIGTKQYSCRVPNSRDATQAAAAATACKSLAVAK